MLVEILMLQDPKGLGEEASQAHTREGKPDSQGMAAPLQHLTRGRCQQAAAG